MLNWFVNADIPLAAWITVTSIGVVACILGAVRRPADWARDGRASLKLTSMALVVPVLTLVVFVRMVVQGSSESDGPVSPEYRDALDAWFGTWPLFFFLNPISGALAAGTLLMKPRSLRASWTCVGRASVAISAALAWQQAIKHMPSP